MRRLLIGATVFALFTTVGCIKRTETIIIRQDGSAVLLTQIQGDPEDLADGDALPATEAGWRVVNQTETNEKGDVTAYRTARLDLPPGVAFPTQYAAAGSEAADLALAFPTTLTMERRADGVYYHFRREYRARVWTAIEYFHETILNDDKLKALGDKNPAELTDSERQTLVRAFIEAEAHTVAVFVDQACEQFLSEIPQETRLAARQATLDVYDADKLMDEAMPIVTGGDETAEQLEALDAKLRKETIDALKGTLAEHRVSPAHLARFIGAYEHARALHDVTEDLGDEEWMVVVKMPGRIIAHNCTDYALRPLESPEGEVVITQRSVKMTVGEGSEESTISRAQQALTQLSQPADAEVLAFVGAILEGEVNAARDQCGWTFDGKALRDRNVVLMATSFVPNSASKD